MASPDGHTRPFDARAGGTVFSDGVAIVVLRRLADAVAAGDTIYAVLLGAAVNNDGSERASFTAPSPDGQAAVIAAAHDAAGIDARSLSYVEAHGTATPLGDPIEIEGLDARVPSPHRRSRLLRDRLAQEQRRPPGDRRRRREPDQDVAGAASRRRCRRRSTSTRPTRRSISRARRSASRPKLRGLAGAAPATTRGGQLVRVRRHERARGARRGAAPIGCCPVDRGRCSCCSFGAHGRALKRAAPACALSGGSWPSGTTAALADVAHTLRVGRRGFSHRRYVVAATASPRRRNC